MKRRRRRERLKKTIESAGGTSRTAECVEVIEKAIVLRKEMYI